MFLNYLINIRYSKECVTLLLFYEVEKLINYRVEKPYI